MPTENETTEAPRPSVQELEEQLKLAREDVRCFTNCELEFHRKVANAMTLAATLEKQIDELTGNRCESVSAAGNRCQSTKGHSLNHGFSHPTARGEAW